MKTRIITAIVALLVFIPILIFGDFELIFGITLFNLATAVLSLVGVYEALKCVGEHKKAYTLPIYICAFLLPLITREHLDTFTPVCLLLLFYIFFVGVVAKGKIPADKLLSVFALTFYVTVSFGALTALFYQGSVFFPLVFVGAWVTDTFAYFTGFFFGKHKLIPEVSPKKTVEGAIGGTLFATVGFALTAVIYGYGIKNVIIISIVGIFASIVSQFGDLSASLIKRFYNIKDYGSLFPGHGGVLDRFDSILAVSAFLYAASLII